MDLKRGDIIIYVLKGDYGKPRPAVVIQSNLFNDTHASITVCPITTHIIDAPLFRLILPPTKENGLNQSSQIMTDKVMTLQRDKIREKIGVLSHEQNINLNTAIKIWLEVE